MKKQEKVAKINDFSPSELLILMKEAIKRGEFATKHKESLMFIALKIQTGEIVFSPV